MRGGSARRRGELRWSSSSGSPGDLLKYHAHTIRDGMASATTASSAGLAESQVAGSSRRGRLRNHRIQRSRHPAIWPDSCLFSQSRLLPRGGGNTSASSTHRIFTTSDGAGALPSGPGVAAPTATPAFCRCALEGNRAPDLCMVFSSAPVFICTADIAKHRAA